MSVLEIQCVTQCDKRNLKHKSVVCKDDDPCSPGASMDQVLERHLYHCQKLKNDKRNPSSAAFTCHIKCSSLLVRCLLLITRIQDIPSAEGMESAGFSRDWLAIHRDLTCSSIRTWLAQPIGIWYGPSRLCWSSWTVLIHRDCLDPLEDPPLGIQNGEFSATCPWTKGGGALHISIAPPEWIASPLWGFSRPPTTAVDVSFSATPPPTTVDVICEPPQIKP